MSMRIITTANTVPPMTVLEPLSLAILQFETCPAYEVTKTNVTQEVPDKK